MAVADAIIEVLGTDSFTDYERSVYNNYQEMAERDIVSTLNALLSSEAFLRVLKTWGAKCACKFYGFRDISIRLKSGRECQIHSPVFLKAKPKKKEVEPRTAKKDDCGTLALNYSALLKK